MYADLTDDIHFQLNLLLKTNNFCRSSILVFHSREKAEIKMETFLNTESLESGK